MRHVIRLLISFSILVVGAWATGQAAAQCVSLTTAGSAYTQNFDTLSNVAGSTTNSLTLTGWFHTESGGGVRDNEQYAVDTGASNTGDTYSYGAAASTERALGGYRSGTLIPTFGACFTNNTGVSITSLAIAYNGEEWRLGTAGRTDQINFAYSTNATDLSTGSWTDVAGLNFVTPDIVTTGPKDGNAAGDRTALAATISALSIANGATFWIRWTDNDASGADDGLAVDDFSLTPNAAPVLPNLSINDVSLSEGNAGTTTFTFTASLSTPAGPGGVTFDIATADGTALGGSDYVARSLTGQTIPAGSSTYTFSVNVNGDSSVETNQNFMVNITNVTGAVVIDGQGSGTILNDDVAASADLSVSLVDSSDPVLPGEILSYTVTVTNAGADEATAVSWSDTLATGTTFVSLSSPAGWSCTTPAVGSPGTASCSAFSLAAGASGVATLNVNVEASTAAGTVLSNTVTVSASVADPVPENNSATATTTVAMASTTTTITAHTPSPSVHGQGVSVTYAVTVAAPSTGSPGGSVTVSDGTASCVGTVASGGCVLTPTTAGAKTLSATYSGDASFSGSTSPGVAHVVNVVQSYREPSPSGGGDIVVSFSGGGATCSFAHADFSSTLPAAPPAGVRFTHGLFDFVLQGCTPTAVNFTITYPTALPPGTQYWKYGPTPDDAASHWYVLPATITGNQVTFSITDGGLGDDDWALGPNGTVVDQGGPGAVLVTGVPALSAWSMAVLSALLLLSVVAVHGRRFR